MGGSRVAGRWSQQFADLLRSATRDLRPPGGSRVAGRWSRQFPDLLRSATRDLRPPGGSWVAGRWSRQFADLLRSATRDLRPLLLLLLAACNVRGPIEHDVTIAMENGGGATVTAVTELATDIRTKAMADRVDAVRAAILDDRDEWSVRFGAVRADDERVIFDKRRGVLRRAERSASIARDDLQKFFADTPMTIALTRGDGWTELAIYPGTSTRATRAQRERVQRTLDLWSADAANYFAAVHRLYGYLDANPHRARSVFRSLVELEVEFIDEEELALIDDVVATMERIVRTLEESKDAAIAIDEEFDLVYNPFPAEIAVRTPREIVAIEGFERKSSELASIPQAGLVDAINALEGKWISPDPLALVLRAEEEDAELPSADDLARMPRKSTAVVTPGEIAKAVAEELRPASAYRVRWLE